MERYSVLVLLSTYNGEKYLSEQLNSILFQENVNCKILVRDDGSKDKTISLIEDFIVRYPNQISLIRGDNVGPAESFWQLMLEGSLLEYDYYAFADQDDFWEKDKLYAACSQLNIDKPSVYCGSYKLADELLNIIPTLQCKKYPDIYHAFYQNIATGCTMVINRALLSLIIMRKPDYLFMHDEWVYKVGVFIGADIVIDYIPHIYYRQHSNNVIGSKQYSLISTWYRRMLKLFIADKKTQNHRYKTMKCIYQLYADKIPKENFDFIENIIYYKELKHKLKLLFNSQIYKHYILSDRLNLFFLLLLNKL